MSTRHDLKGILIDLRLKGMADALDTVMAQAAQHNLDLVSTLGRLADIEREQRLLNAIALRWRQSKLTEKLTIDQFDFSHHKSRHEQKTRILNLLNLDFVRTHMDVILIGNPGAGKTFLAKCLAYAACNANMHIAPTGGLFKPQRSLQGPARCAVELYVPHLIFCPSSYTTP
jgi:DNA replication protein DnaC